MIHNVKVTTVKAPKQHGRWAKVYNLTCSECGVFKQIIGMTDAELHAREEARRHTRQQARQ
jgi:hypothetical protein